MLLRHAHEPPESDERHHAHEPPCAAYEPRSSGHRRERVAATGPDECREKDRDRKSDRQYNDADAAAAGMLEDDAVDDPGEVQGRTSHGHGRDPGEGAHGLDRLPSYDAAADDLVAVVEDSGLTRRHEGRRLEVERRMGLIHVDVSGKWDAAIPQDHVRRKMG